MSLGDPDYQPVTPAFSLSYSTNDLDKADPLEFQNKPLELNLNVNGIPHSPTKSANVSNSEPNESPKSNDEVEGNSDNVTQSQENSNKPNGSISVVTVTSLDGPSVDNTSSNTGKYKELI